MFRNLAIIAYCLVAVVTWWFLVGKNINRMYKQTLGDSSMNLDRKLLVFIAICDIFMSPLYMPIEVLRRAMNRLADGRTA